MILFQLCLSLTCTFQYWRRKGRTRKAGRVEQKVRNTRDNMSCQGVSWTGCHKISVCDERNMALPMLQSDPSLPSAQLAWMGVAVWPFASRPPAWFPILFPCHLHAILIPSPSHHHPIFNLSPSPRHAILIPSPPLLACPSLCSILLLSAYGSQREGSILTPQAKMNLRIWAAELTKFLLWTVL